MKNNHRAKSSNDSEPASKGKENDILSATHDYERWMRSCTKVIQSDLRLKHKQMRQSPFQIPPGNILPVGSAMAVCLRRSVQCTEGPCGR